MNVAVLLKKTLDRAAENDRRREAIGPNIMAHHDHVVIRSSGWAGAAEACERLASVEQAKVNAGVYLQRARACRMHCEPDGVVRMLAAAAHWRRIAAERQAKQQPQTKGE